CRVASEITSPNVKLHGWIENIVPSIDAATVVLRPTRHDGMPLMVLEALGRGRYVIWSRELAGVLRAATAEEIVPQLTQLEAAYRAGSLQHNEEGLRSITESFSPQAVTASVECFLDDLVNTAELKRASYAAVSRRRAVASGTPSALASFIERMSLEAPQWDIHPLIGKSRSERLDDALAMAACERWFSIGEGTVDPIVAKISKVTKKERVRVDVDTGFMPRRTKKTGSKLRRVHLTLDEWRALDACHPAPTFFARPSWAAALERTYPGMMAQPELFYLPKGEALLPLMRSGRRFVSVEAMPLGTYTLPLQDGAVAGPEVAAAIVRHFIERNGCDDFTCTLWPLARYGTVEGCEAVAHQAAVIDLRAGSEAAIAGFKGVARRMAGQAVRKGVTVKREPGAVDVYYRLLEDSARRWGLSRPHLPRIIFDALVEFGGDDVEIWIARYDGEAIAGGVMMYGSTEAFFWSAAMRGEYSSLRPSNLLNVEMIRASAERGMHWYNLGANEGLVGVDRFKESLGAEPIDYVTLTWRSEFYRKYQGVRSALERRRATKSITAATI
ncbi:MAG: GNAT family N-acetyltransferase, partial [Vulcanimicrobiaceae bacterium]